MADLLVTGTDTGVGKTVVAAALLLALRERGVRAIGFKPVETGVGDGRSDAAILAAASDAVEPLADPLLSLSEPLAPAVAADRASARLDPASIAKRLQELRASGYRLIVEGAGGLLVPLSWGYTALDLAAASGLQAILVARAGLGTLNHCALTAEALRQRGVPLRGIVLNGRGEPPDLAEQTNPEALRRLLPEIRVVVLPRWPAARDALDAARRAAGAVDELLS